MQTQRKHAHFMQKDHKLTGAFEPRTFKLTARKSAFILCQTKLPVHVSNLHKSLNFFLTAVLLILFPPHTPFT